MALISLSVLLAKGTKIAVCQLSDDSSTAILNFHSTSLLLTFYLSDDKHVSNFFILFYFFRNELDLFCSFGALISSLLGMSDIKYNSG